MFHYVAGEGNVVLQSDLAHALEEIDLRILNDGTRDTLEVNRPGRIVPHYQFIPSLCNPEPWGSENYNKARVHKKVGKKSGSRR
jgi:hypothetical protein